MGAIISYVRSKWGFYTKGSNTDQLPIMPVAHEEINHTKYETNAACCVANTNEPIIMRRIVPIGLKVKKTPDIKL